MQGSKVVQMCTWKVEARPVGAALKGAVLLLDIDHARLLMWAAVQTLHRRHHVRQ